MLALSQGQSHALGLDAGEVVGLDWVLQGKNFPTFFLNFKFILVIFFFGVDPKPSHMPSNSCISSCYHFDTGLHYGVLSALKSRWDTGLHHQPSSLTALTQETWRVFS